MKSHFLVPAISGIILGILFGLMAYLVGTENPIANTVFSIVVMTIAAYIDWNKNKNDR